MHKFIFLCLFFVSPQLINAMKVSFFGTSFITVPLQEAKLSTNIRLKFRTRQENGLIFLAAGRTDYCLLKLEFGRIVFLLNIDSSSFELWSPPKSKWNDLLWHEVSIQRYEQNLTMQVDDHFMKETLPMKTPELNIHFGTFVGGVGHFTVTFINDVKNFRGCICDVFYNNINILKRAKEKAGHAISVDVVWNCSADFDAKPSDSVSLVSDSSFMLEEMTSKERPHKLSFEYKTAARTGLLLWNSKTEHIAIQISEGKLWLYRGPDLIALTGNETVSDGRWHYFSIWTNQTNIFVLADDLRTSLPVAEGNVVVNLAPKIFFGGASEDERKLAFHKGINLVDVSFKGCLRNITLNHQEIGLADMEITKDVIRNCLWSYPCLDNFPCNKNAVCHQHGFDEFICSCQDSYCLRTDYASNYKIFSKENKIEILKISPLRIREGDTIYLSSTYIEILFDFSEYYVPESSILFYIVELPKYGALSCLDHESGNFTECQIFSFFDLLSSKVKYDHYGMESSYDHITIDLQILTEITLLELNNEKYRFVLHIDIVPVNDPPVFHKEKNVAIHVIQGMPTVIGPEVLNCFDPDNSATSLIYRVITTENKGVPGRFEINGNEVKEFSQADINQGLLTYTYNNFINEPTSFELKIQISDGIDSSDLINFPVSVHPLHVKLINNTGLLTVHRSSIPITPSNLSAATNSDRETDLTFNIVEGPVYGLVERLREIDSSWISTTSFTQNNLYLQQVRYRHTQDSPPYDEIKFTVSCGTIETQQYTFPITFTKLSIMPINQINLTIFGTKQTIIQNIDLAFQTTPISSPAEDIRYRLTSSTTYGSLYKINFMGDSEETISFTQSDIDKNIIGYRTFRKSYSNFVENLQFIVSSENCNDVIGEINLSYFPTTDLQEKLNMQRQEPLRVNENEKALITRLNFEILFNVFAGLTFFLSKLPQHGTLCILHLAINKIKEIYEFTLEELYLGDVYYCHDGSEAESDYFELLALSDEKYDFQYNCEIAVEIKLINDNPPQRISDNILYVVSESSRKLSASNLFYADQDINTKPTDILYTHVSCFNGEFYKAGNIVDYFSQSDINGNEILFRHHGPSLGTATFVVTDGIHEVPGVMEIRASEPFISAASNNALVVQEMSFTKLDSNFLSITTNLDAKADEFKYKIIKQPSHGIIIFERNKPELYPPNMDCIDSFTQLDVNKKLLIYWNVRISSMDRVDLQVEVRNLTTKISALVRIYPSAYWDTLTILQNNTLFVEEFTSALISKDILQVIHPKISPGDIAFLITSPPKYGYLEVQSAMSNDEFNPKIFDQSTINSEKVFYIQATINQTEDSFTFDVTNGITWLRNLSLKIVIIPQKIYIDTKLLRVIEGKSSTIKPNLMAPFSDYFKAKIIKYRIIEQPHYGTVVVNGLNVTSFTFKDLDSDLVRYVHFGDENLKDSLKLIAITHNKESEPFELHIQIIPVNDEKPTVIRNYGLEVWNGSMTTIRNSNLMAYDNDSPPENLVFIILQTVGGHLTRKENIQTKINYFTQEEINNENIYFVHNTNSFQNEIHFIVSDGVFNTSIQTFYINVKSIEIIEVYNRNLKLFPLTTKAIHLTNLLYKCSNELCNVKYYVTKAPKLGNIILEQWNNGTFSQIDEFSQKDINDGRVFYENKKSFRQMGENDSFIFDVSAANAIHLMNQIFVIEISLSYGDFFQFLRPEEIEVDEGKSAPIVVDFNMLLAYLKSKIEQDDTDIFIKFKKPEHGFINFDNVEAQEMDLKFYPRHFITKTVFYYHDHSDSLNDEILMYIYLQKGSILLLNVTIPVKINPVNDQPFRLVTQSPQITVVEGENKTLTEKDLLTQDLDTTPEDIIYEVISGPTLGILMKLSQSGNFQDLLVYENKFTQEDLNNGRIIYQHYGPPQSTSFYFKVFDGKFKPAYEIFQIKVLPIALNRSKEGLLPLYVRQGDNTAILESYHMRLETNVHFARILYNITNSPLNGIILLDQQPTLHFSQIQLENKQIKYMQTDMSRANDSFQTFVYIAGTNYGIVCEINVKVKPYISIDAISATIGEKVKLRSNYALEHFEIVYLNSHNFKINILQLPKIGKIEKKIRSSTEEATSYKAITSFTYTDLLSGLIYYTSEYLPAETTISRDYLHYSVEMMKAQPAFDEVLIETRAFNKKVEDIVSAYPKQLDYNLNYITLSSLLGVFLLIILIALYLIRFKCSKYKSQPKEKSLPQPVQQIDLLALNNNLYTPFEQESSLSTQAPFSGLSNVPQCKIISIEKDDSNVSNNDTDFGPMKSSNEKLSAMQKSYTSREESPETTERMALSVSQSLNANPLLRRNQYWV